MHFNNLIHSDPKTKVLGWSLSFQVVTHYSAYAWGKEARKPVAESCMNYGLHYFITQLEKFGSDPAASLTQAPREDAQNTTASFCAQH